MTSLYPAQNMATPAAPQYTVSLDSLPDLSQATAKVWFQKVERYLRILQVHRIVIDGEEGEPKPGPRGAEEDIGAWRTRIDTWHAKEYTVTDILSTYVGAGGLALIEGMEAKEAWATLKAQFTSADTSAQAVTIQPFFADMYVEGEDLRAWLMNWRKQRTEHNVMRGNRLVDPNYPDCKCRHLPIDDITARDTLLCQIGQQLRDKLGYIPGSTLTLTSLLATLHSIYDYEQAQGDRSRVYSVYPLDQ
jgi:hypothetical protein